MAATPRKSRRKPLDCPRRLDGRIGVGFGWTTLAAAEMAADEQGIDRMALSVSDFPVTDVVIPSILVIGPIAFLFDLGMR